jgi:predicted DNA-binding protein (MmcQ/YjbR family)
MYLDDFRKYCLKKPFVTEGFPFDERTLVFKVDGKVFALLDVDSFEQVNLKCAPDKAVDLREQYNGILPGYHMNKTHWNTVRVKEDVPVEMIYSLVDESYNEVVKTFTKKRRNELSLG